MLKKVESPDLEQMDDSKIFVAPKRSVIVNLIRECRAADKAMDDARSELGGVISDAVENKKVHKGALAMARKLDRMLKKTDGASKLREQMFHFKLYCDFLGIDEAIRSAPALELEDREDATVEE